MFELKEPLGKSESKKLQALRECLKNLKHVYVAYSGGVDSALVAAIAKEQLGSQAIAITGVSAALAPHLLEEARKQAIWIGIEHQECTTKEIHDPNYNQNPTNRCYSCKKELHHHLNLIAKKISDAQVIDGVNHDDIYEYRPGIKAAREAGVRSPLAELKINKLAVRQISRAIGLPWWNKPAQPCLASRFPYGQAISIQGLDQVGKAEKWLIDKGFPEVRVRSQGLSARIEVPSN